MRIQQQRLPWRLREVEVVAQITELSGSFPDIRSRVRSSVGFRVESLTAKKIIFDEFGIGIVAQYLMVNVALFCIRADNHSGNT